MSVSKTLLSIGAATFFLFGQSEQIPNWWFSADPKKVVADPQFVQLSLSTRSKVLSQIDPKFAKMKPDKQDQYVWNAETANLPKAGIPKVIVTWNSAEPISTSEVTNFGDPLPVLTKKTTADSVTVQTSLNREFGFFHAHIRISNGTSHDIIIQPQVFILEVVRPKPVTLFFEYPTRVSYNLMKSSFNYTPYVLPARTTIRSGQTGRTVATIDAPDPAAKKQSEDIQRSVMDAGLTLGMGIEPKALKGGGIAAGARAEGDVYFERSDGAREVILKVFVSDSLFQFPFNTPKE